LRGFDFIQALIKLAQSQRDTAWVLVDPTLGNFLQRNWVDIVKFLTAAPKMNYEIRPVEQPEMFTDRLAAHVQMPAKLVQGLAVSLVQSIEQSAAASIGQGFENGVHWEQSYFMQPNGCMSSESLGLISGDAGAQGKTGFAFGTR
jgi:hypothetical protein